MRKIVVVAGLLVAAAMFSSTPAKAWVGCVCVKLGAPGVCMRGPVECAGTGGACLLPCDYAEPKPAKASHKKKKKM